MDWVKGNDRGKEEIKKDISDSAKYIRSLGEFDIEVLDDYLDRARGQRKKYIPKD